MTRARTAHCADHARHVGVCPACQRARLEAEKRQLAEVREVLDTDGQRERAVVPRPEPEQADQSSSHAGIRADQSSSQAGVPTDQSSSQAGVHADQSSSQAGEHGFTASF